MSASSPRPKAAMISKGEGRRNIRTNISLFVLIGCQTNFNLQQQKRSHKVRRLFIPAIAMDESLLPYSLNNFPLPDDLVPLWASEIDHISHSISLHDQRMKEGVASIERHARQRVELCDWKDFITSLRSAVRRLPAEVIAQIIFFSLELDQKPLGESGREWFMTLRSVSSSWRRTAFSTPALWQSLEMDIAQTPDFAALAISWLSRGGPENKLHLQLQSTKDHDSFDTVAPLIEHPSFRFSTLVLGVDILRRWKCVQSFMQPSASKATVEALTLRLPLQPPENPPIDPVPPGASISLLEAFPRAKSLVLQGHIKYAPVTHPSLTSLAIDGARLAASDLSCLSQNFPSLEELVIAGVSRHVEWDNSDLQSIVIPSLKRLTLTTDDTQKVMQALTCSNLQWLHLSDIPNAKWFDPLFQIELKAFIEKSKKTEFTLRVTSSQDSLGNILPGILAHSLPIHRLEVQGIDWLSRRRPILLFDGEHDIPSSLCEIVAWETPRKLKFIPRNVGAVRNGPLEGPRRTIEVYFPGGKEELDVLGVRCDEKESQVYLNFHCMSKEAIQHKMHRQNPILCHAYNKLLGLFDA